MSAWQDILSVAAVGTERQEVALAHAEDGLGRALSRLDASDREGALLRAVALAALHRQAGFEPAPDPQPAPEPCEVDEAACCSSEAGQHLALMLEGEFKEVLPEWLAAMREARRRAPAEHLPALFEKGRAEKGLRPLILHVVGARGSWLAAQHDAWRWAAAREEADVWETGGRDERLHLLRTLRETDPAGARELLASTWKSEAARDRASFMEAMRIGLGDADEPFLHETLGDRSAEVRNAGAELLLRLPSSRLRRLVAEKVGGLLSYKKPLLGKARIEVALPSDPDAWQKEQQIPLEVPTGAAPKTLGKKGWWLLHAVGWVPPSTWGRAWGRKPAEVLDAAEASEWKEALLGGLNAAASRHGDAGWPEAILSHRHFRQDDVWGSNPHLTDLAAHLPTARREALILDELAREAKGRRVGNPALRLLLEHRNGWGDRLSRSVLAAVKERMGSGVQNDLTGWQLKGALKQFALYVSPALAEELSADWPAGAEAWWQEGVNEFQSVLRFRRDMLRAIVKEGNE